MNTEFEEIVKFHGHSCPGIAIGYRMAKAAMERLSEERAKDEEIVAIVENKACGGDAVQFLTGCTFGKGNFFFRDYGKQVYTFYSRKTGRGYRVVFHGERIPEQAKNSRENMIQWLMGAEEDDIIRVSEVDIEEPPPAKIVPSVKCDRCGEMVMETRAKNVDGIYICIPCSEE